MIIFSFMEMTLVTLAVTALSLPATGRLGPLSRRNHNDHNGFGKLHLLPPPSQKKVTKRDLWNWIKKIKKSIGWADKVEEIYDPNWPPSLTPKEQTNPPTTPWWMLLPTAPPVRTTVLRPEPGPGQNQPAEPAAVPVKQAPEPVETPSIWEKILAWKEKILAWKEKVWPEHKVTAIAGSIITVLVLLSLLLLTCFCCRCRRGGGGSQNNRSSLSLSSFLSTAGGSNPRDGKPRRVGRPRWNPQGVPHHQRAHPVFPRAGKRGGRASSARAALPRERVLPVSATSATRSAASSTY